MKKKKKILRIFGLGFHAWKALGQAHFLKSCQTFFKDLSVGLINF